MHSAGPAPTAKRAIRESNYLVGNASVLLLGCSTLERYASFAELAPLGYAGNCFVPEIDGAYFSERQKEALWDRADSQTKCNRFDCIWV